MSIEKINATGMGLLGCGKMGSALLQGWLQQGVKPENVYVIDPAPSDWLLGTGVKVNKGMPAAPAVVLIAVKPQMMGEALPVLTPLGNGSTLFVSIAAGTKIAAFENVLGSMTPIIRVMPNTPCLIGKGASGFCLGSDATPEDSQQVGKLLSAIGVAVQLHESLLDGVTGLSGSGPAFVYQFVEALSDGGVRTGLPREVATRLAAQTVMGAAAMILETGEHPGVLKDRVASPGGTTIAGIHALEQNGFRAAAMNAVVAAAERSKELGK